MSELITDKESRDKAFPEVGSVPIPFRILTHPDLTPTEKILYSYILNLNSNRLGCFASLETIGIHIGTAAPTIKRSLRKLIKLGLIKRIQGVFNSREVKSLFCVSFVDEDQLDYKMDQLDPREGSTRSQKRDHSDPDTKIYTKIDYNNTTEERNLTLKDEKTISVTNTETYKPKEVRAPSPKVPQKGVPSDLVPCPDHDDNSLSVRMTLRDWERLSDILGAECALYWCEQLENYAEQKPKAFREYKNHYRTIMTWHKRECGKGLVFGWTPQGGYGFYKHWVQGLKVGGKSES